jgi:hypothetical protein
MLMYVPAETPVTAGQAIRLTFGKTGKGEMAALTGTNATIVRVERAKIIALGHLPVGVKFSQPIEVGKTGTGGLPPGMSESPT